MDRLSFGYELKSINDDKEFSAYASTFGNEDLVGDIVEKGAFAKSIALMTQTSKAPKLLYQHQTDKVAGVITNMQEDLHGLLVKGKFIDTTIGRDAYVEVKSGAITDMSIGFRALEYEIDQKNEIRRLKEVELLEVSFVSFPANPKANITSVKSEIKTIRDLEKALRDAGLSMREAKAVCAHGHKGLLGLRDEDKSDEVSELLAAVTSLNQMLKQN